MKGLLPPSSDRAIRPLRATVIAADPGLLEDLHGCLRDLPVQVPYEGAKISPRLQLLSRLETLRPDVIFFELDIDRDSTVSLIRAMKSADPLNVRLIVNRAATPSESAAVIEQSVGLPVYFEIPDDGGELYAATLDRKLLTARSRIGKHFGRLSRAVAGIAEQSEALQPLFPIRPDWLPALGRLLR